MAQQANTLGYLPDERPTTGKLLLYALQQVIVMFPATVAVALITGFQVSTTIFASGLATLCFIFITGRKIPLYYGSSFAYLTAVAAMCAAEGFVKVDGILPAQGCAGGSWAGHGRLCNFQNEGLHIRRAGPQGLWARDAPHGRNMREVFRATPIHLP